MGPITNVGRCPPAVLHFVLERLADTVRRQENPHWLRRLLGIIIIANPSERTADVRWFSECDEATKTCSGYLLGRWLMCTEKITAFEYDFAPDGEDDSPDLFQSILHTVLVNFAFTVDSSRCIVNEIDLKGRMRCAAYELPDGAASKTFGPVVGPVIRRRIRRDRGDQCVPEGWRPRQKRVSG